MTSAAQIALSLPELLEPIILLLPPSDVVRAPRVAEVWRDTIENSTRLRQHRVLKANDSCDLDWHDTPKYTPSRKIKVHRVFRHYAANSKYPTEHSAIFMSIDLEEHAQDSRLARRVSNDFAFLPPCPKLWMCIPCMDGYMHCTLYVRDGIRVKDVVDVGQGMWDSRSSKSLYGDGRRIEGRLEAWLPGEDGGK